MRKQFTSLLLVIAMLVSLVAMMSMTSCGPTQLTEFEMPDEGYDGSAVTITFYHTMGSNLSDVLNYYIVEFNKLYPNITINHTQVGGYDDVRTQISTELMAGNHPNIAYCYPDHVALYNNANAVVTLDQFINNQAVVNRADGTTEIMGLTDAQKADFIPGYYNEGMQFGDGKMYTMPLSKSTEVFYYNKTFFDQHGIKVPTTWDELEQVCEQIKAIDPKCIPLGYDSEANWFITMCEQLGSDYTSATAPHFLFNNETNRAFVEEFRDWYQKGYVTTQEILGSYTSSLFTATEGTRSYMSIGSSAGATHQRPTADTTGKYPFEVGIAPIPQANKESPKAISQGPSLCVFKKDNPQEVIASWLFVKYLTTNVDFQAEFSMASGYVPVIKSVAEHPTYKKFLESANGGSKIAALSAKVCMDQVDSYYTSPAFNGSSFARDEVGLLMQKCFEEPATDVKAKIKELFEQAVKTCEYQIS